MGATTAQFPGFTKPNYTPVPDEIFDQLLGVLSPNELRALLYICRRTFGFGKDADAISFNQFIKGIVTQEGCRLDHGCGITNPTRLSAALKSLETRGYIAVSKGRDERGENHTTVYRLRFCDDTAATTNPAVGVLPDRQYRTTGRYTRVLPDRQQQETVQETVRQVRQTEKTRSTAAHSALPSPQPQLPLREPLPLLSNDLEAVWTDALALLREQVSPTNFAVYLEGTRLVALSDSQATIQAVAPDAARWLQSRWPAILQRALAARLGRRVQCRVVPPD
jgi:hypothetical protein